MTPARRAALGLAAIAALACGDIASPIRNDLYEWRLIVPGGAGEDTVHFHWGREDLPVRVWVSQDEISELQGLTRRAIDTWESAFLYGEFTAELVSDSNTADVIVRGVPAPEKIQRRVTRLPSMLAPECGGATDLDINPELTQLTLPIRMYVDTRDPGSPTLADCLALTTIHELGHALGIFAHSPNATDIMFADPVVDLPSELDRGTAEALYHVTPTIEAVRP